VGAAFAVAISLPVVHRVVPNGVIHDALGGAEAAAHDAMSAQRSSNCPKQSAPSIVDAFPRPRYLRSKNGQLTVGLRAEMGPTEINGQTYQSTTYNGEYPGPMMVICQGDELRINVRNALDRANYYPPPPMPGEPDVRGETNIHTHGFHVTPRRPSDNIFVVIEPGEVYRYRYEIPRDHPPGFYWYHPHRHGQTNVQDFGGMNGGIIIKGGVDSAKGWRKIGTRDLVLNQTALGVNALGQPATFIPPPTGPFAPGPIACTPPGPPLSCTPIAPGSTVCPPPAGRQCTLTGTQWFVNGALNPTIDIQPGQLQRWRIANASAGAFACLQLQGPLGLPFNVPDDPQTFKLIATDGNYLRRLRTADTLLIGPSSRREILVMGPSVPGNYAFNMLPLAPTGGCTPSTAGPTLATVNSSGDRVDAPQPPRRLPDQQRDLRDDEINTRHQIVYSQQPPNFFINGEQFTGPDDVMEKLELNKTSEWTIQNTTTFWHTFHIHINDFQITELNGEPYDHIEFGDNISIPPGQSVTLRYRPTDFTGKFVFHCHVLGHEDNGMMAVVQVVKNL
jgi:suppressor of ftsI